MKIMYRTHGIGLWVLIIMITFSLAGCTAKETPQTSSDITSDIDQLTKQMQANFDEKLKYRGKKTLEGISDELLIFYADVSKGYESAVYHLNTNTGTVVEGISGMPLYNLFIQSRNLNELSFRDYLAAIEELVLPILKEKGYSVDSDLDPFFNGYIGDGFIEYQLFKDHAEDGNQYIVHVEPFTKVIKELGEVERFDDADEASSLTDDTYDTLDEAAALPAGDHLDDFIKIGYQIIEEQTFQAVLQPWGNVRFVSGYLSEDKFKQPMYHIVDSEQKVLFTLPPDMNIKDLYFEGLKAVSFKDMNEDKMKDIIVIGEYSKDSQGQNKGILVSVYFSSGEMYSSLPWYNDQLNNSGNNRSIQSVVAEGNKILKKILPSEDRREQTDENLDVLSSFICTDKLLSTGDLDYGAISESVYLFSYSTTFSESYLPSSVGACFAKNREELLVNKNTLKAQVEQYDQLMSDLSADINSYHYIETGGGTMWNIVNAYSYLQMEISLNQYAQGKTSASSSNHPDSQIELEGQWSEFHEQIKSVINNKYLGDRDNPIELSSEELDQIKEIEQQLNKNMPEFIKRVSNDSEAEGLANWMMNKFSLDI
ncbi:hypothetical protein SAMN04488542_1034 [Fontibacillus panacisegetis]|uniref:Uncharacterized protein n=1 Tax=Fontibacillus panacisegetis TaxID=670482 RepID=A0A1G7GE74_9BACL|nr:hypothetical protein [Fontibacillus panacisegetis]SDE86309.1 hypothetical protein SAMN04488542_1034 [Fontibacillus panacisegetis]